MKALALLCLVLLVAGCSKPSTGMETQPGNSSGVSPTTNANLASGAQPTNTTTVPTPDPKGEAEIVAALEKIGGEVKMEGGHPIQLSFPKPMTKVTDKEVAHIGRLPHLRELYLGFAEISDDGLAPVANLKELQILALNNTPIGDAGLAHLADLRGLGELELDQTKITDAGLAHLKGLKGLETLTLGQTEVSDAGLESLKNLTRLKKLNLKLTKVTEAGVAALQKALPETKITYLD